MMGGIAAFAGLQLHDGSIDALHLDFARKEIEITVEYTDQATDAINRIVLHCTGVAALSLGRMRGGEDLEIGSAQFTRLPSGLYGARFVILQGWSLPSWEFSFEFADGSITSLQ